jgi:hypothetical protein
MRHRDRFCIQWGPDTRLELAPAVTSRPAPIRAPAVASGLANRSRRATPRGGQQSARSSLFAHVGWKRSGVCAVFRSRRFDSQRAGMAPLSSDLPKIENPRILALASDQRSRARIARARTARKTSSAPIGVPMTANRTDRGRPVELGFSGSTLSPGGFGETMRDCGSATGAETPGITTPVVGPEGIASIDGVDGLSTVAAVASGTAAAATEGGADGWAAGSAAESSAAGGSSAAEGLAALPEA